MVYHAVSSSASEAPPGLPPRGLIPLRVFENISNPPNRAQQLSWKRVVHLAAEAPHVHIDHIGVPVEVHVPNGFGDQRTSQNFPGAAHQIGRASCRERV